MAAAVGSEELEGKRWSGSWGKGERKDDLGAAPVLGGGTVLKVFGEDLEGLGTADFIRIFLRDYILPLSDGRIVDVVFV